MESCFSNICRIIILQWSIPDPTLIKPRAIVRHKNKFKIRRKLRQYNYSAFRVEKKPGT